MLSAALAQSTTPGPPENLVASTNESSIFLTWNPPTDQGNSSIMAYIIYKGEDPGTASYYTETPSTSYEDFNINIGTTYYYQVSARNEDGEGPRSGEVSATLFPQSYMLSGHVADRESDEGVDGARLEFQYQGPEPMQFDTWTDSSGSYSIELVEGNYRVRIEADGYDTIDDYVFMNSHQTMDFEFEDEGGGSEDFNLSDMLGIDEDKVERYLITTAIIAGVIFSILPLMLILVNIMILIILIRTGKVRKELRARNEKDGIFISKRRKKKHEGKAKKIGEKKEDPKASSKMKKKVEIDEEDEEEEEN
jgi:hypothetical protein